MSNILPFKKQRKKKHVYLPVRGSPHLKRDAASGIYYLRWRGFTKSTGERRKGKADAIADRMMEDILQGKGVKKDRYLVTELSPLLLRELQAEYKAGERREATIKNDPHYLRELDRRFPKTFVDEIDEDFWKDYSRTHRNERLFETSKYLSKLLTFAYQQRLIPRKPTIRNPDPKTSAGREITDSELRKILKHADPLLRTFIVLAYENGLRTGEIRCMKWEWLAFKSDRAILDLPEAFVKANARTIELSQGARKLLSQRRTGTESSYVFPARRMPHRPISKSAISKVWKKTLRAAKVKPARFYDLRHTFYTKALLTHDLPIQHVSQFGGTSIATLERVYLHQSPNRTRIVSNTMKIPGEDE